MAAGDDPVLFRWEAAAASGCGAWWARPARGGGCGDSSSGGQVSGGSDTAAPMSRAVAAYGLHGGQARCPNVAAAAGVVAAAAARQMVTALRGGRGRRARRRSRGQNCGKIPVEAAKHRFGSGATGSTRLQGWKRAWWQRRSRVEAAMAANGCGRWKRSGGSGEKVTGGAAERRCDELVYRFTGGGTVEANGGSGGFTGDTGVSSGFRSGGGAMVMSGTTIPVARAVQWAVRVYGRQAEASGSSGVAIHQGGHGWRVRSRWSKRKRWYGQ